MDEMMRRDAWNPTPEEFAKYKEREIELCKQAMKKDPMLKQNQTLFSIKTWDQSLTRLV